MYQKNLMIWKKKQKVPITIKSLNCILNNVILLSGEGGEKIKKVKIQKL